MAKRPPRGGPRPASPATEVSPAGRQLHTTLAALHTGATAMATIGGLALYAALAQVHVAGPLAVLAGLLFALLGRIAAVSLGREWLVRTAARRQASSQASSTAGSATPTTTPTSPRR